jgi:hypothetical protein
MKLPSEHSHVVDFEKIKREAFTLLNLGYGFLRLRDDDEDDVKYRTNASIFQSFGDLYSREVSSLLVSISISGRMLDDMIIRENKNNSASRWEYEEILGDDADGNPLSLRDCFNKVIHAERIDHELMQLPEVNLSGKKKNDKEWHARLFILPFCVSVFEWVGQYNA